MNRYLVLTLRTPNFASSVVDKHYAFLDKLRAQGKLELAGPFSDKSGGAYILRAADMDEAKSLAFEDPVHTTGASVLTVYEWNAR